jgi:hypothetical protein
MPGFFLRMANGRIVAMRIPSRRIFWLSAAILVLAVIAYASFLMPRGRITQENYDRIQKGMSEEAIKAILGEADIGFRTTDTALLRWDAGYSYIVLEFYDGALYQKHGCHFATAWETIIWHARNGARKIGVKCDEPSVGCAR